jgi:hypothetical protein
MENYLWTTLAASYMVEIVWCGKNKKWGVVWWFVGLDEMVGNGFQNCLKGVNRDENMLGGKF